MRRLFLTEMCARVVKKRIEKGYFKQLKFQQITCLLKNVLKIRIFLLVFFSWRDLFDTDVRLSIQPHRRLVLEQLNLVFGKHSKSTNHWRVKSANFTY